VEILQVWGLPVSTRSPSTRNASPSAAEGASGWAEAPSGFGRVVGLDGGLMYVSGEDIRGNRCPPRGYLSQLIRSLVVPSGDVVELESVEFVFQAPNLVAVGLHLPVVPVGVLHDLINDELRVATSVEAPNP
jgi:hypothetical protein